MWFCCYYVKCSLTGYIFFFQFIRSRIVGILFVLSPFLLIVTFIHDTKPSIDALRSRVWNGEGKTESDYIFKDTNILRNQFSSQHSHRCHNGSYHLDEISTQKLSRGDIVRSLHQRHSFDIRGQKSYIDMMSRGIIQFNAQSIKSTSKNDKHVMRSAATVVNDPNAKRKQKITEKKNSSSSFFLPNKLTSGTAVIINAKYRTGSSLTGEFFNHHSEFAYYFEPLHDVNGGFSVPNGPVEKILRGLFTCNLSYKEVDVTGTKGWKQVVLCGLNSSKSGSHVTSSKSGSHVVYFVVTDCT